MTLDGKHPQERVLLARIGALGDAVMALPVAQALKKQHGTVSIDFLCSASTAPLLRLCPSLDCVFGIKGRNVPYFLSLEKRRLSRRLRERGYQRAILMESAEHFFTILEAARIRNISSYLDHPFDPQRHSVDNNLKLAGLGLNRDMGDCSPLFDLEISKGHPSELPLDDLPRPLVGLHPGYGPPHRKRSQTERLKGWPQSSFTTLGRLLQEAGASIVLTGSAGDVPDCRQIAIGLDPARTRVLAGQTHLPGLARLLASLDLFVSVDSGPAHLCAALGTPLVVLWGPAKLVQTRPLSSGGPVEIVREEVPCSPCYDTPAMRSCRRNVCMDLIRPQKVYRVCRRLLDG